MTTKIVISTDDITNIHETRYGIFFNIKGAGAREFTCNYGGYVFEFIVIGGGKRLEMSCYFATPFLVQIVEEYKNNLR